MKKVFALVLSLMMILCSVSALATEVRDADTIVNGSATFLEENEAGDADIDVRGEIRYRDEGKFDVTGEAATELWLQVEASGQIDVTVPLVLVFQTNIDGGEATSPNTYKITNHSSADLVVTQIKVTDVATEANKQPMTKVAYIDKLEEDQYKAKLNVDKNVVTLGKGQSGEYDLKQETYTAERHQGGIFELAKAEAGKNEEGTATPIALTMKTGRLSFITSRVEKNPKDANGQLSDEMDTTKGIQLMTITYTVAIDTSDAYGEVITTNANVADKDNLLDADRPGDTASHGKIVENTVSNATKDGADQ